MDKGGPGMSKNRWKLVLVAITAVTVLLAVAGCFHQAPTVVIQASPLGGKAPLVVEFVARVSCNGRGNVDLASCQWNFGDGTTGSGERVTHTYTVARQKPYLVTVEVTDTCGSTGSASQTIEVRNPGPACDGILVRDDSCATCGKFCAKDSLTFSASNPRAAQGQEIVAYEWDFGNGSGTSGRNVVYAYPYPGKYTVKLTLRDGQGVSNSFTKTIMVEECYICLPEIKIKVEGCQSAGYPVILCAYFPGPCCQGVDAEELGAQIASAKSLADLQGCCPTPTPCPNPCPPGNSCHYGTWYWKVYFETCHGEKFFYEGHDQCFRFTPQERGALFARVIYTYDGYSTSGSTEFHISD